ncbi:3-hydroxyacyl-CoA dehydrogenase [Microbacterium sp. RD1]|uniref:3-hydroxyacyl-CoA dehydrogenase n=1 Tax=Microbacterium sp. RD1 TaxID=3457313 RepID=UPI003FA5BDCB
MTASIAVVGSGSIGVGFAVLFARAGCTVRVFDPIPEALERAAADVEGRLRMLADAGLRDESVDRIRGRIGWHSDLVQAVAGADLVQECAPERVDVKRELFTAVASAAASAVLASSSSAILASEIAAGLDDDAAARLLIGHPGNPPYLLPVIEIVPSPRTAEAVSVRAAEIYRAAGLRPIRVRREVEGFVFNRLQGAVLREAYCLVRDGVADVADIDEIVRSGLGRRWSVIGPFETSDLNVRGGIVSHAGRMGLAYERMGAERGQHDPWTDELVAEVDRQRREILPLDEWDARVRWRDAQLLAHAPLWDGAR